VQLEFDGRYAAMLSHEPKNYALLDYEGALLLRGVAFRSRRAEPYGEAFLKQALNRLLSGDVAGVREAFLATIGALRRREIPTYAVTSLVRLTKTRERYLESRERRRELPYEAMLASGRASWNLGERIRVYRSATGVGALVAHSEDAELHRDAADPRDYDVEHYIRVLRDTFAARLARALAPDDFKEVFADPDQLSLFPTSLAEVRPILTAIRTPRAAFHT
jgi:hypothetical protein